MSRDMAATLARGWIDEQIPEIAYEYMTSLVERWAGDGTLPPTQLWLDILNKLRKLRLRDAELSACELACELFPGHGYFTFRQAEALYWIGRDDEADALLAEVAAVDGEVHDLRLRLATDDAAFEDRLGSAVRWAESQSPWGAHHTRLLRLLADRGQVPRAGGLMRHWLGFIPVEPGRIHELAMLAMHTGNFDLARRWLTPHWARGAPEEELVIGRFGGTLAPFGPEREAAILARIEGAIEPDAPPTPLPDHPDPPPGLRIIAAGFETGLMGNDIVQHFVASGRAAGQDVTPYLEDALTYAFDLRVPDAEIEARLQRFEQAMEAARPDVLILDWSCPFSLRGINPHRMALLRQRLGFRLVVAIRDAHEDTMAILHGWLPAVDSMLLFNPTSAILEPGATPYAERLLVIPVPAFHTLEPPPHPEPRQDGLLFVGNIHFSLRYALLSVLLTEALPFHAIYGKTRAAQVPDAPSYHRLLESWRATLNVSAHTVREHLVTGRIWEATNAGTLLVEQDNPATRRFFLPWCHYLPWTSIDDIADLARFVAGNPKAAQTVASRASAWAWRHYSPKRLWAAILGHANRANTASPEGDVTAAADWARGNLLSDV
jgi:hypothetical protein